ncbi:hypothetical protein RZS08_30040, partial [Arthrospira platensis SPKY1]|nr:hypothetical protein [Arthrospira platensis SPKY1]
MADRLHSQLGSEVVLARVSGNAFGLLGPAELLGPDELLPLFEAPLLVKGQPHRVSVTLGLCDLDDPTEEGVNWLKNASIALKQAKRSHRGQYVRFTRDMALHSRNRAQLLSRLHSAFDHDHLYLAFQPQIDLNTGALIGLEAL